MPGFSGYIIICSLITVVTAVNTVLNVDEINSIHYAIDILNKPVVKDQGWDGEVMTVVNKHGQEYICSLPSVAPLDSDLKHDDDIFDQLVDISVLLKPMETAPCLIKTVDWWTYEFCYGSVIKQYHLEDNKATGPIIILGKYESEYNWRNSSETKNRLQRFHSQFYVNGTKCDLTTEPRRTEVRFHCEDGVGDYIQRVDEPESCRYVVTVATTRVCHHPYLRLQSVRTPHTITCAPALTYEQYHKYLSYQNKKIKEEQKLKEKWIKQNAEILQETASEESQSILQPISTEADDDDEELKMNIKIFRLSPVKKQKNQQSTEVKADIMEVETQITLEESDTHLKVEEIKLSTGIDEISKSEYDPQDIEEVTSSKRKEKKRTTKENLVDVEIEDEESLIHDLQAQKLLQLLDESENYRDATDESSTNKESSDVEQEMSEPYLTEVDELEEEEEDDSDDDDDDDDDVEELEAMRQASKSTKRDHFSKLRRRLRQLGKMFMNQEVDGERKGEKNKIEELQHMVDSLKDGHIKQLEQEVKEWTKKLLNKDILLEMDEEDLEEEEQRLGSALSSLMDALDEAENKLSTAMKGMETLGEFLDSRLKEMESSADESQDSASEEPTQQDGVDRDSQDPIEGMSQAPQNPEDPVEETSSMQSKKNVDKVSGSSRQLRIVKHKMEDESHKTKLEQKIKDRLQKLGLEKIGRKFEVKILTPNSLEDEDTNNPLLSQEETEAFQNMIVNLLSANAEELEERENHRKLEKNYGFKWDDSQFAEDEEE